MHAIRLIVSFEYQDRLYSCNATEVTTHTGQNNHLFFAVCIYIVHQVSLSIIRTQCMHHYEV